MAERFTIVGLGEALFDVFPDRQVLGGAPLNVAVHAHQLAQAVGGRGVVVSRVGQDALGQQVATELADRGMTTEYLQTDPDRETGKVYVSLDETGQPSYEIAPNVAWDVLQFDPDVEGLAARSEAVCFGSLAQRDAQSRSTIYRFLQAARRAVRLFDVNLRQNYYDRQIIRRSCESATVVKLNTHELSVVADLLGLDVPGKIDDAAMDQLSVAILKKFNLKLVALTRSQRGTVLYSPAGRVEGPPVRYDPIPGVPGAGADAVGAGDACAAGLLVGLVQRWPLERVVALANHVGAFVASQPGGTPKLPDSILAMVRGNG